MTLKFPLLNNSPGHSGIQSELKSEKSVLCVVLVLVLFKIITVAIGLENLDFLKSDERFVFTCMYIHMCTHCHRQR